MNKKRKIIIGFILLSVLSIILIKPIITKAESVENSSETFINKIKGIFITTDKKTSEVTKSVNETTEGKSKECITISSDKGKNKEIVRGTKNLNEASKAEQMDNLKKLVEKSIPEECKDRIGLMYYDLNSGMSFSLNEDKDFKAASTVKVPLAMSVIQNINEGKASWSDTLTYNAQLDYEDGAGALTGEDLSSPITIEKLVKYSIVYSDNIATRMLMRYVNGSHFDMMEKIVGHDVDRQNNLTTPKTSCKTLIELYNRNKTDKSYDKLIDLMKNTIYHDRIDKYISQGQVAHKIGDFENYVNDIAIVYDENPYVLVVFSYCIENANDKIAEVSKIIYDEHLKLKR